MKYNRPERLACVQSTTTHQPIGVTETKTSNKIAKWYKVFHFRSVTRFSLKTADSGVL